jgi:hypothetical protein
MKVFVKGQLIDAEVEPICIVFKDDAEKEQVVNHLSNMAPKDNSIRVYCSYPENSTADIQSLFDQIVKLVNEKSNTQNS